MTEILSLEALENIATKIISDYSIYLQGIIDVSQARASINYQISLMANYEYTPVAGTESVAECRSICILPKNCDLVDISMLLNMHKGIGRYILTIRHEGGRKYAVHCNKLYFIDVNNPSRPFDKVRFTSTDKYVGKIIVHRTKTVDNNNSNSIDASVVRQKIIGTSSVPYSSSPSKSIGQVAKLSAYDTKSLKISSLSSVSSTKNTIHYPIAPLAKEESPMKDREASLETSSQNAVKMKANQIYCPTNNVYCCYTNKNHCEGECRDPSMMCCKLSIHYTDK